MRPLILAILLPAAAASAQDGGAGIAFDLSLGLGSGPTYFGADSTGSGVAAGFSLERFSYGSIGFGGGTDSGGLGLTGSFRYISPRTAADSPELTGLADIDAAVELGGGITYSTTNFEAYAVARQGFGGHDGITAEVGGDLIFYPLANTTLRVGPRVTGGDDTFAATYFGVDAATGDFGAYAPSGGIISRGLSLSADYAVADNWGLTGTIRYDELVGDAASSPITQTTDQVSASVVVTRNFSFGF